MKSYLFYLTGCFGLIALFSSCGNGFGSGQKVALGRGDSVKMKALERESAMATYYVLVVDTGSNYYALRDKMYQLSKNGDLLVDTMGRYYDHHKNLIVSDCDVENIYEVNDYLPRVNPSNFLSLEHFSTYYQYVSKNTMALIGGIYESELSADVNAEKIKQAYPQSYVLKASVYKGD